MLNSTLGLPAYVSIPIIILTVVIVCFIVGVLAKTELTGRMSAAIGGRTVNWAADQIEDRVLKSVPKYASVKKSITKIMGGEIEEEQSAFSAVALVDVSENGRLATAFVTDTHADGSYTVFIPTAPNPTSGVIYHLDRKHVHPVDVPVDVAMRSVVGCGAGSREIVAALRRQSDPGSA